MIPLPVILVEFLVAFGVALFGANALALLRLRRDRNWPPVRPTGAGRDLEPTPSAPRIVAGIVVGLVVALWAVATWLAHHFRL